MTFWNSREFPPSREEIISLLVNRILLLFMLHRVDEVQAFFLSEFCFFPSLFLTKIYVLVFLLYLQGRRELSAVVHCYGGGSCKITINSATTAGEVKMFFLLNLFETRPIRRASTLIRSLSTNDCDGYENFAWKVKSLYFKLHRAYFICCFSFANLNLLLFCRSRWRRRRRCLSSLISREPWKNWTFRPCSPSCLFCDYDKW